VNKKNIKLSQNSFYFILIVFIALVFSKLPTLYNYLHTPPGYWYVGHTSWFDAWDIQVYLSAILFGERHGVMLQNAYTTISHTGVFIYQYYTLLGVVNKIVHTSPIILFQLSSIISSIFLITAIFVVINYYFKSLILRYTALTTAVLGGGFGWIPGLHFAADLQSAGLTTVNAFERGHDAFSTACFILSFYFFIRFVKESKTKLLTLAILLGVLNFFIHPPFILVYAIAGILMAILGYFKYKHKIIFVYPLSIVVLFSIYYFIFLSNISLNAGFSGIVSQKLSSVPIFSLLLGLGIIVPFLINLFRVRDSRLEMQFIRILFVVQLALMYIPTGFELYFLKGIYIWAVILAFDGIAFFIHNKKLRIGILCVVTIISLFTRIYTFNTLMHVEKNNTFFFLKAPEHQSLQFLDTVSYGNVLSLFLIGNYIPAYSDNRVFIGHAHQTPHSGTMLRYAAWFYVYMNQQSRKKFIAENNIKYIYYGNDEKKLRKEFNLSTENPFPEYKILYNKGEIIIYQP
jgi:hypothetical protein